MSQKEFKMTIFNFMAKYSHIKIPVTLDIAHFSKPYTVKTLKYSYTLNVSTNHKATSQALELQPVVATPILRKVLSLETR
jgi:hypothetical protein